MLSTNEGVYFKFVKPTFLSTLAYFNISSCNELGIINSMVSPSLLISYQNLDISGLFTSPIKSLVGYVEAFLSLISTSLSVVSTPLYFIPGSLSLIKLGAVPLLPNIAHLYALISATTIKNLSQEDYHVGGLSFKDSSSIVLKNNDFLRFSNINYLKFKYDYKNGNYLTDTLVNQFSFLNLSKVNMSNNKRFNS